MRDMKDVDSFDKHLIMEFLEEHKVIYTAQDTMEDYVKQNSEPVGLFGSTDEVLSWLDKYTK